MEKYNMDLSELSRIFDKNTIPVEGNKHRMVRVAFDLFRVDGDEADDLWQVQADDDGKEFLVRLYSTSDEDNPLLSNSSWDVLSDKKCANFTISFKKVPLMRIASKDFGAETKSDGKMLQGVITKKIASDSDFVKKLIYNLPNKKKAMLNEVGLLGEIKNYIEKISGDSDNYKETFDDLLDEYKSKYDADSLSDLNEDKRKEMFEEIDLRWKAENEAVDPKLVELENKLTTQQPEFDFSDVDAGQGEFKEEEIPLREEDIEEIGTYFIEPQKVNEIIKQLEALGPKDREALLLYLKS